ncbi:hypothetical protein [Mycobacterium sp. NAZ190054]|uniref:hypothetical protein n=1 Tax=Mycobacterium sp. NAZ190054 TaxID=1747766 RepID=UPI00079C15A3|nr:hypothetical protein [Mycobacterium sp. NAZ190054]KWX56722.1 hypothetical protein ASJ79_02100 [Mycobacterium sp. NAZ190054]
MELLRSDRGRRWLYQNVRKRLRSHHESICLRRDLTEPFTPPPAKIPFVVRQLQPDDDLSLIADEPGLSPQVAQLRADQRWLLESDLPRPWVAIDQDGAVGFMAYLLTAEDNARIETLWGDWLPQLKPDEVMLEGLFTSAKHRGLGLAPDAGTVMVQKMVDRGIRYGLGFILTRNSSSLRMGEKGGWMPYLRREEDWFLFRRRVRFLPLNGESS